MSFGGENLIEMLAKLTDDEVANKVWSKFQGQSIYIPAQNEAWKTALNDTAIPYQIKRLFTSTPDNADTLAKQFGLRVTQVYRLLKQDAYQILLQGHKAIWGKHAQIVWVGSMAQLADQGDREAVNLAVQKTIGVRLDSLCRHHGLVVTVSIHPKDYLTGVGVNSPSASLDERAENPQDTLSRADTPVLEVKVHALNQFRLRAWKRLLKRLGMRNK